MGHRGRFFPPGPLPSELPVGFKLFTRAQGYVAGLMTSFRSGINEDNQQAVSVIIGTARRTVAAADTGGVGEQLRVRDIKCMGAVYHAALFPAVMLLDGCCHLAPSAKSSRQCWAKVSSRTLMHEKSKVPGVLVFVISSIRSHCLQTVCQCADSLMQAATMPIES
jgi:hypothetical protein